jgi:hypothetical protein
MIVFVGFQFPTRFFRLFIRHHLLSSTSSALPNRAGDHGRNLGVFAAHRQLQRHALSSTLSPPTLVVSLSPARSYLARHKSKLRVSQQAAAARKHAR